MTLVMTLLSNHGVAMAADSAVRFGDGRVYLGAQKLLPVRQIEAGMSVWGLGTVGRTAADEWLDRFIQTHVSSGMTLHDLAHTLADKLNHAFGGVAPDRMGVHVAGITSDSGVRGPALYHVLNGNYHLEIGAGGYRIVADEDPPIREFRAQLDYAPRVYPAREFYVTRNGDFGLVAALLETLLPVFADLEKTIGLVFPHPDTLESHGEYLRFWINQVKEIYRLSNKRKRVCTEPETSGGAHIGGPVTVLTIAETGIRSFYVR